MIGCFAALLGVISGCSERGVCLDKLDAEVKRQCQTVTEDECSRLRRQQLEKMKIWDALTDDEKARSEDQCAL